MLRSLSLQLQGEPETQLPLTRPEDLIKTDDVLDLSKIYIAYVYTLTHLVPSGQQQVSSQSSHAKQTMNATVLQVQISFIAFAAEPPFACSAQSKGLNLTLRSAQNDHPVRVKNSTNGDLPAKALCFFLPLRRENKWNPV